jgi:zinc transport system ATP-binding protein
VHPESDRVAIQMEGGTVRFGEARAIKEIDLSVCAGGRLAILGENGCGKTTLIRAILGLQTLSDGSSTICGQPVAQFKDWSRVGYVPQQLLGSVSVPVSVAEIVGASLVRPLKSGRLKSRERATRVSSALASVGLEARQGARLDTLSGGQQRRVLIAGVLAKDPQIYILDEPTAGVDLESQQILSEVFSERAHHGCTIIFVTHELDTFSPLIDRAIVMSRGSIIYDGNPEGARSLRQAGGHRSIDPVTGSTPQPIVDM